MNYSDKLPEGWAWVELGAIVQPIRPKHNPQDSPELPFIGLEHLEPHTMKLLGTVPAKTMRSSAIHFQPGDLLYGRLRPYLNKVYRPDFEGLCSAEFIVLPPSRYIDQRYLQYLLNSWDFVTFASHLNEGDRPRVDFAQIATYPVPLPPLPEQHRIVVKIEELFSRLDAGVGALRKVQDLLKMYRASVLDAAYKGKLVETEAKLALAENRSYESGEVLVSNITGAKYNNMQESRRYLPDNNLPKLPDGWTWSTLGQLFEVCIGATPNRSILDYWNGDIPWVTSSEVAFNRIKKTKETITKLGLDKTSTSIHPPGTVLLGMIGEGKTRGQAAILDIHACNNQNCAAIRVSKTEIPPEYVYYYLEKEYRRTRKIASGNNQPALNKSLIRSIWLPVAPLSEQQRIVVAIEKHMEIICSTETVIEYLLTQIAQLRESILKLCFEGRLVPQDPTDEPASKLLERIRAERARMEAEQPRGRKRRAN